MSRISTDLLKINFVNRLWHGPNGIVELVEGRNVDQALLPETEKQLEAELR